MKLFKLLTITALMLISGSINAANESSTFTIGDKTFLLNGQPFVVKAAEVHYPRIPRPYWEHRIQMCKALGMNTLCIYVFWNIHEQREGQFDFTDNNDVAEFCRLAQKTVCMSSYVLVHTYVPSGRWAVCLGGCLRRKISVCASAILILWSV